VNEDVIMNRETMKGTRARIPGRRRLLPGPSLMAGMLAFGMLLGGCGGGGSRGGADDGGVATPPPTPPPDPPPVAMVIDELYEVDDGARLVNRSAAPSRIEVRHRTEGSRFVILREGAADLHP
jgi:hypothetical protein